MSRIIRWSPDSLNVRDRTYQDTRESSYPACQQCEHCDGEKSPLVRVDALRGRVCPVCDEAIDEMEESNG